MGVGACVSGTEAKPLRPPTLPYDTRQLSLVGVAGVGACVSGVQAKPLRPPTLLPLPAMAGGCGRCWCVCFGRTSEAFETPDTATSTGNRGWLWQALVRVFRAYKRSL